MSAFRIEDPDTTRAGCVEVSVSINLHTINESFTEAGILLGKDSPVVKCAIRLYVEGPNMRAESIINIQNAFVWRECQSIRPFEVIN